MNLCTNTRYWVNEKIKSPKIWKFNDGKTVAIHTNKKIWFKQFITNDNAIILSWTNKQMREYNTMARQIIFGKKILEKFEINDRLILDEFYKLTETSDKSDIDRFYTSEQIKVIEIGTDNYSIIKFPTFTKMFKKLKRTKDIIHIEKFYNDSITKINMMDMNYKIWKIKVVKLLGGDDIYTINVLHDDTKEQYDIDKKIIQDSLISLSKKYRKPELVNIGAKIMGKVWKYFHNIFVDPFASVDYGYCITCHTSQGSTYKNVFIDALDILKNINTEEAKRCMYTAITRSSDSVSILVSK
jgi:hypothetical protein